MEHDVQRHRGVEKAAWKRNGFVQIALPKREQVVDPKRRRASAPHRERGSAQFNTGAVDPTDATTKPKGPQGPQPRSRKRLERESSSREISLRSSSAVTQECCPMSSP